MNRATSTAIATAELQLLLRYLDEGITIRRENIERVLAALSGDPVAAHLAAMPQHKRAAA